MGAVYRITDNKTQTSFVIKFYTERKGLENDYKVFKLLRKYTLENEGVRVVDVLERSSLKQILILEDVRGYTLEQVLKEGLLPHEDLKRLMVDFKAYQDRLYEVVSKKILSETFLFYLDYPPLNVYSLRARYGFFGTFINLKPENILVDLEKKELVIIDPF